MIRKHIMDNGIRIITEEIDHVNSIAIGIWIKVGSRNEEETNSGVSHFIEHMMFKGTEKRNARQIANEIDKIGGQMNAFTSKECTCYYIRTLDTHFDIALDVLSDMIFNSKFDSAEMEKEKGVILEEINMYEDSPEDQVHDIYTRKVFLGNQISEPILGTSETVKSITEDTIREYMSKYYIPENIVISVVGKIKTNSIVKNVENAFGKMKKTNRENIIKKPTFQKAYDAKRKETEQIHLCMGYKGLKQNSEDTYTMHVLNNIFGGSMSSRLFQTIREQNGLSYSVFSYSTQYMDAGLFTIYAGMHPSQLERVVELAMGEIKLLKSKGISPEELYDSKEQLKGSYMLGLESTNQRMVSIGRTELLQDKIVEPDQIKAKIDEVNMEKINALIEKIFAGDISAVIVGKIADDVDIEEIIKKYK